MKTILVIVTLLFGYSSWAEFQPMPPATQLSFTNFAFDEHGQPLDESYFGFLATVSGDGKFACFDVFSPVQHLTPIAYCGDTTKARLKPLCPVDAVDGCSVRDVGSSSYSGDFITYKVGEKVVWQNLKSGKKRVFDRNFIYSLSDSGNRLLVAGPGKTVSVYDFDATTPIWRYYASAFPNGRISASGEEALFEDVESAVLKTRTIYKVNLGTKAVTPIITLKSSVDHLVLLDASADLGKMLILTATSLVPEDIGYGGDLRHHNTYAYDISTKTPTLISVGRNGLDDSGVYSAKLSRSGKEVLFTTFNREYLEDESCHNALMLMDIDAKQLQLVRNQKGQSCYRMEMRVNHFGKESIGVEFSMDYGDGTEPRPYIAPYQAK